MAEQTPAEKPPADQPKLTETGLAPNVAGLLCYVLGWISGLIFLLLEPKSDFIRFHAKQSIIVFGALNIIAIGLGILGWIRILGFVFGAINWVIGAIAFVLWIVLMVKAYQGARYKIPWAGERAERWRV